MSAVIWWLTLTLIAVSSAVIDGCLPSDRAALLAFRAALREPYLGIFNTWTGSDCCHWYGVSCDPKTYRVDEINLAGESDDLIFRQAHRSGYMTGNISHAICRLKYLSSITITDWKGITGDIPRCISSLPFLQILDLTGNRISSPIPGNIGRLRWLTFLSLADNLIYGRIPPSITKLTNLMHLDLRQNQLSGRIPRQFGQLKMLSRALLSHNRLAGWIPHSISEIYRLADFDLSSNQLSGPIPDWLGKMEVLSTLNLDGNKISGTIPGSLLNSRILNLNLSRNALNGNIPDSFGPRSYFITLDLSYNNLEGTIPKSLASAGYIGSMDVSHNHIRGQIPPGSPFDHL
ncbi:DNA damage-repair/toleration protein DRT100-like [Corylus avellana]|uniref:DNA damage-repair/toleration protein DRT100-like n=1 Tax=Corylus avellana TaxID=13451 RepID=UPI001E1FD2E3|nr:DNA damage-repair/toleration protein DRT100-like [Corylus avellana]